MKNPFQRFRDMAHMFNAYENEGLKGFWTEDSGLTPTGNKLMYFGDILKTYSSNFEDNEVFKKIESRIADISYSLARRYKKSIVFLFAPEN